MSEEHPGSSRSLCRSVTSFVPSHCNACATGLRAPVILIGISTINRGLVNAAILSAIGFVPFADLGAIILATDTPLAGAVPAVEEGPKLSSAEAPRTHRPRREPPTGAQRHPKTLDRTWWEAVFFSAGRLALDYPVFARRDPDDRQPPTVVLDSVAYPGRYHRADLITPWWSRALSKPA